MSLQYPVFSSPYYQRGYGVPSLWKRTIKPLLKRVGLKALRHGARLGARVAHDVAGGKKVGQSLKRRAQQTVSELVAESTNKTPNLSAKRSHVIRSVRGSHKKREKDIFD